MIEILWEFEVKLEQLKAFELHYGAEGTWAQLFRKSSDYGGTVLLRDAERPRRYLTIDRWSSVTAFGEFKQQFAKEYRRIDEQMEHLTESENRIGVFESL